MEFKKTNKIRRHYIKKSAKYFSIFLVLAILVFEIFSAIYVGNYENLDIASEAARNGGEFFNKDGDKMYFEDNQKNADVTLLFVHGFGASTFSWRKNYPYFYQKERIVLVDLLGFGLSKETASKDIGVDRSVEVIKSLITEKKMQNVIIVGHSLGGAIAQKLALQDPKHVIGLVLINSTDADYIANKNSIFTNFFSWNIVKNPVAFFQNTILIAQGVRDAYYDPKNADKLTIEGYQKAFQYKNSSDELVKFVNSNPPSQEDVSKINVPTLIYSSQNDKVILPKSSQDISGKIKSSKLITIPSAGHLLMEEQPQLVNEGINRWIDFCLKSINVT